MDGITLIDGGQTMASTDIKASAHALIDTLPDNINWNDLAYHTEVRASIERGLDAADKGQTYTSEEVKKHLGLDD